MRYYAVIDTNVIISSMIKSDSIPGEIIELVKSNVIIPIFNEEILEEYEEVATRNKFGFTKEQIEETLSIIKDNGLSVARTQSLEDLVDKDDLVFYEIVLSARSVNDTYLVTGNLKHYPVRSYIVTPHTMIDIINRDHGLNN